MTPATLNNSAATASPQKLNKYSARITQPASQGASQAMLIATGLSWEDLNKPQIGIGAVWYDGNPCNMHLADLANHVKRGAEEAGCAKIRGTEEKLDVVSAFQAYGQKIAGKITEDERKDILSKSCPGQGACG